MKRAFFTPPPTQNPRDRLKQLLPCSRPDAGLLPVLLFTCAKTKLGWYIFCIYPSAALFAAMAFRSMLGHQPEDFSAYELICRSEAYSLYHHKTRNQLNCNQHICDMQANVVAVASKSRFAV